MNVLDFDKDSDEFAQFAVAFPKSWNAGTVTFQFFWSGIAATTGVELTLAGVAFADNDSIDTAYGTAVAVADAAQGAVEELLVSAESGAVTIAGSPWQTMNLLISELVEMFLKITWQVIVDYTVSNYTLLLMLLMMLNRKIYERFKKQTHIR